MTKVTFRRAVAADVETIDQLLRDLAAHDGGQINGDPATLLRHGFAQDPKFRVVLAEHNSKAVGLCLFFPEYSSWRGKMGVFVQDLYVSEHLRGAGVGKRLLIAAMDQAADWTPEFVTLMVQHKNTAALEFYRSNGFVLREKADILVLEGPALSHLCRG